MPAPSLKIPLSLDMSSFKSALNDAKSATSSTTSFIVKQFVDMNASALAASGAAGATVLGLRSLLGTLGLIGGTVAAVSASFELMSYATELAKDKIDEFNKLAASAGTAGVSTDFFQRWVQGAQQLKLSVSDATEALDTFNKQSKDQLGGSQIQQEITKLTDAGNLKGNTGVAALGISSDTQQKLQAVVTLIDQALDSGQRLAGLDIANKAFGPKIADNLAADSGYLDKMLATASSISASKIISDDQIGQAITLKTQLDAAQQILTDKWKPIQDDLAKLGMNYQQSWVEIYTDIATAVGYADSLYESLKKIPDVLAQAGSSPFWTKLTELSGRLGLNSDPASLGITLKGQPGFSSTDAGSPAFDALKSGLQNSAAVQQAMQKATSIQSAVRGDTSKAPGTDTDDSDAVDHAIDSLNKHNLATQADADAVGKGAAALAVFRAQAQETASVAKNGGEETADQAAQFKVLEAAAGAAALALAKAQVADTISRGQQTSLLDPQDVAIANQLKNIYPDVATAMKSPEAEALRLNQAISGASSAISNDLTTGLTDMASGAKTASQAFSDMAASVLKDIEQMIIKLIIVQPLMQGLQGGANFLGIGSLLGIGSAPNTAAMSASSATLANGTGGAFFGPGFASGTDNAPGGMSLVGENGPEILNIPRGSQVIPNDVLRKGAGGGGSSTVYNIDASGADSGTVARIQSVLVAHARAIGAQGSAMTSSQRFQSTGVN